MPYHRFFNLPNILSILRILLTPLYLYFLFKQNPQPFFSAFIFFIAGLTDFYDGYLARKYGMVSKEGIFLDPFADKVLVLSAFYAFYLLNFIPLWMVIAIAFRELFITCLRLVLVKKGIHLASSKQGKWKTTSQFGVLFILFNTLYLRDISIYLPLWISTLGMYCALFFTYYSAAIYLVMNRVVLLQFLFKANK